MFNFSLLSRILGTYQGAKYEFGEAMAQNKPFFFFADWEREGSQNAEK